MARIDVLMPQMGESIAEGTLSKWLKKLGDEVKRDEPLFEISTDKVDAEIPAPTAGTLVEIKVQEGQTVPVQTLVAVLETEKGAAVPARLPRRRPPLPLRSRRRAAHRRLLQRSRRAPAPVVAVAPPSGGAGRRPQGRRRRDRRGAAAAPLDATRPQDRLRASARYLADSRDRLRRARDEAGHPGLYRACAGRTGVPDTWHPTSDAMPPSSTRPPSRGPATASSRGRRSARSRRIT